MNKKVLFFVILLLPFFSETAFSHVDHYKELKKLEFELFRNNKLIGTHIYNFKRNDNFLEVESEINFKIKKLGVVLYKYFARGLEKYDKGKLISFDSNTIQNKKEKFCKIFYKDNKYFIEGSSYKGPATEDLIVGTWWNHEIINKKAQISAISGRIINQKVTFLGKEKLIINGKNYDALHFNFSSTDKNLKKNKKLNTDVWYEEKTLTWIKASFDKQGYWEYRLKDIK